MSSSAKKESVPISGPNQYKIIAPLMTMIVRIVSYVNIFGSWVQFLGALMTGFGELFRYLSFVEDIGSAAILSRAVAGVYQDTAVFSMPGSRGAIRLAMQRLILHVHIRSFCITVPMQGLVTILCIFIRKI